MDFAVGDGTAFGLEGVDICLSGWFLVIPARASSQQTSLLRGVDEIRKLTSRNEHLCQCRPRDHPCQFRCFGQEH